MSDRLTIDISKENSFLAGLCDHIKDALSQSREQYKFVIYDRKDEYAKEQRDLLKDLKNQADLYADKIRGMLNSLLRDSLAGLLLVSLTVMGKVGTNLGKFDTLEVNLLFKALSIYFIVSIIMQVIVSWRDIHLSKKELKDWASVTRQYMSHTDFTQLFEGSLSPRFNTFLFMMIFFIILYFILAAISWQIQSFVECFYAIVIRS